MKVILTTHVSIWESRLFCSFTEIYSNIMVGWSQNKLQTVIWTFLNTKDYHHKPIWCSKFFSDDKNSQLGEFKNTFLGVILTTHASIWENRHFCSFPDIYSQIMVRWSQNKLQILTWMFLNTKNYHHKLIWFFKNLLRW